MKAKEVMEVLRISRSTLYRFRKEEQIKCKRLPNGSYEYDGESVYEYLLKTLGKSPERKTVIYARVSTNKQKPDMENQLELLRNFCIANGWKIGGVYKDIASALSFEKRKDFEEMVKKILDYQVERVVISFKDRLTRAGFGFFQNLFTKYSTEIVVIHDYTKEKSEVDELMEEIFTLLHGFSMKFYSNRRKLREQIKQVMKKGGEDEECEGKTRRMHKKSRDNPNCK